MTREGTQLEPLARIVLRRFREDRCLQIASSLTFTSLLALVPIVTVALTVLSLLPMFEGLRAALNAFVVDNLVPASAGAIVAHTAEFTANAGRLTALGISFFAVTAILLLLTIDRAFNTIWRARRPRPLVERLLIYSTLIIVGPAFAGASLALTSWLVSAAVGFASALQGVAPLVLTLAPIALTAAGLTLLYKAMPNCQVALRDAAVGGVAAGLVFEVAKRGFAFYVTHFASFKLVYGAFAAVPVFLLWIYVSWLVVIFGAVLVAALPESRAPSRRN